MKGRAGRAGCCPLGGVCELPPLEGVEESADIEPGLGAMDSGVEMESRDFKRFILSMALLRLPPPPEGAGVSSLILLARDGCVLVLPPCGDFPSELVERRDSFMDFKPF